MFYGTPEKGYADSGIWEFMGHVYTKDAHDPDNPVKRLIGSGDEYIIVVLLHMLHFNDLAIPKSRQVRMSWIAAAFAVWHTMSAPYRETIWQSKREKDANKMVSMGAKNPCGGRLDFIIQHLPSWLRDGNVCSGKGNLTGSLVFNQAESIDGVTNRWRGSKVDGIPQGGDQIRQNAPSLVVEDEAAFQEEYMAARIAAKPAVTGGGKLISLSSVDAGSGFNDTVLDVEKHMKKIIKDPTQSVLHIDEVILRGLEGISEIVGYKVDWPNGLRTWETNAGVRVLEVSYKADPKKDPLREGAEWEAEAVRGYVGGMESTGWQTEMGINYGAGGGEKVFPQVKIGTKIFIDGFRPEDIMHDHRFYAGYDYGSRNPAALEVWAVNEQSQAFAVWELYEPCLNVADHVAKMKRCPYWNRIEVIMCDPSIMSKTQQGAADIKTLSEVFNDHGLYLSRGRRGQDVTIAQSFNADYWADPNNPGAFITKACPGLMGEVLDLRWDKHMSEALNIRRNAPEKIRDKNNHAWDATSVLFDAGVLPFVPEVKPRVGYSISDLKRDAIGTMKKRERNTGGIYIG